MRSDEGTEKREVTDFIVFDFFSFSLSVRLVKSLSLFVGDRIVEKSALQSPVCSVRVRKRKNAISLHSHRLKHTVSFFSKRRE